MIGMVFILGGIVGISGTGFLVYIYGTLEYLRWNRWNFWNYFKKPYISMRCVLFLFQYCSKTVPNSMESAKYSTGTIFFEVFSVPKTIPVVDRQVEQFKIREGTSV